MHEMYDGDKPSTTNEVAAERLVYEGNANSFVRKVAYCPPTRDVRRNLTKLGPLDHVVQVTFNPGNDKEQRTQLDEFKRLVLENRLRAFPEPQKDEEMITVAFLPQNSENVGKLLEKLGDYIEPEKKAQYAAFLQDERLPIDRNTYLGAHI